ncbi:dinitrogenase iron-molybdenum cofactor biosynthesis protein [Sulfurivermis fontis]|uniref:dinitrogenase iron-molybdenum cofactor biosynthesis protein n=1 Tax=Sulfurivermis fontis TaxID=1972068 RepID=UPI000FD6F1B5|nr:dinitrogenase iron-molybdenum cofactor biosynthesis protein [Sulfurivermis fontis]
MSAPGLSREAALRIGLAARMLPDTDAAQLMKVLVAALGMPVTEDKLAQLTVRTLRAADDGRFGNVSMPALKGALDYLWGKAGVDVDDPDLPRPLPYRDGDMPGSIRVALASNSGENLDGHYGSCLRFLVYQVTPDEARLVDVRRANTDGVGVDKNASRAEQLRDCQLLCVVSIGGPAAAKVVKAGVHPIKYPHGGVAREIIADLQQVLAGSPPPWLARIMGKNAGLGRFVLTEEEAG